MAVIYKLLQKELKKQMEKLSPDEQKNVLSIFDKESQSFTDALQNNKLPTHLSEFPLISSIYNGTAGDNIKKFKKLSDKWPVVLEDGSIINFKKYDKLDARWAKSLVAWLKNQKDQFSFPNNPPVIQIDDEVTLGIFGDWGGGTWHNNNVASKISNQIVKQNADYNIHLGDTYYSGSEDEMQSNTIDHWPAAKKGNFALNGNHEMYHREPYFNLLLQDDLLKLQNGNSYFALENSHWIIVGLDTSFFADSNNLYLDGNLNDSQINFLTDLAKKGKSMILLSHHNGFDVTGKEMQSPLWDQVTTALKACSGKKYWYWGHIHMGSVYKEINGISARCIGHSVIPYGNASMLENCDPVIWYENKPATEQDDMRGARVQNGFSMIRLNNETIIEEIYDEDGELRWKSN